MSLLTSRKLRKILVGLIVVMTAIYHYALSYAQENDIYVPAPIIFVHGYSGKGSDWNQTKNELKKYFEDANGLKYDYINIDVDNNEEVYFPICDYESQNNGDIPAIAQTVLRPLVLNSMKRVPDCQSSKKKVNIVAHSMGGLVTRALVKNKTYDSYIDKVIFIGTPHEGSPHASASWLLNEVYENMLPIAYEYTLSSISGRQLGIDADIDKGLFDQIVLKRGDIASFVFVAQLVQKDPASIATEEVRLNKNVSYHSTVSSGIGNKTKSITFHTSYQGKDTFLHSSHVFNYLDVPDTYKTILGRNEDEVGINFKAYWVTNKILSMGDAFTFPSGESYNDILRYGGDGVVSLNSQSAIGNVVQTLNVDHGEEPNQAQAIL